MPNHHIVDSGDAEKGGHNAQYGYEAKGGAAYEEPFVHGHATIAEAAGTGGATHRGLKSRHIQFL
jgi:amino acid transporter